MADRRVLITGGGGRLAKELAKHLPETALLKHHYFDVAKPSDCEQHMRGGWLSSGDIVIHCAAVLAVEAERDRLKAWAVNVEGTRNICRAAAQMACRVVYISSDYVFWGKPPVTSGYRESNPPCPANFYGETKRAGELIALESPNNLILRAPFRYGPPWAYDNAFSDQFTSARWIGEVAPDITDAALSELTGILHIGGPRRSLYEMAMSLGKPVKESKRADWPGLPLPADTSLDSSRWLDWKAANMVVAA